MKIIRFLTELARIALSGCHDIKCRINSPYGKLTIDGYYNTCTKEFRTTVHGARLFKFESHRDFANHIIERL